MAALAPYVEDPEVEGAVPPKVRKVRGKGIEWASVKKHATMVEAFANYSKAKLTERGLSTGSTVKAGKKSLVSVK